MSDIINSAEKFCIRFNTVVPGVHRSVTPADIRDMTQCGLIGRHGFYGQMDIEIVRGILQYEHLREKRSQKQGRDFCLQVPDKDSV